MLASVAERAPLACGRLLKALLIRARGLDEVAIVGGSPEALIAAYRSRLRPTAVVAAAADASASGIPLLAGREPINGMAAAYVCRGFSCQLPVTTPEGLAVELEG